MRTTLFRDECCLLQLPTVVLPPCDASTEAQTSDRRTDTVVQIRIYHECTTCVASPYIQPGLQGIHIPSINRLIENCGHELAQSPCLLDPEPLHVASPRPRSLLRRPTVCPVLSPGPLRSRTLPRTPGTPSDDLSMGLTASSPAGCLCRPCRGAQQHPVALLVHPLWGQPLITRLTIRIL
jgi:hypothetical protein